jgi:hypothetical protein
MGLAQNASDGHGVAGLVRTPFNGASIRLTSRLLFQILVGVLLATTLVFLVIRPAVDRGGAGELLIIAGIFAAILLIERWLRTR